MAPKQDRGGLAPLVTSFLLGAAEVLVEEGRVQDVQPIVGETRVGSVTDVRGVGGLVVVDGAEGARVEDVEIRAGPVLHQEPSLRLEEGGEDLLGPPQRGDEEGPDEVVGHEERLFGDHARHDQTEGVVHVPSHRSPGVTLLEVEVHIGPVHVDPGEERVRGGATHELGRDGLIVRGEGLAQLVVEAANQREEVVIEERGGLALIGVQIQEEPGGLGVGMLVEGEEGCLLVGVPRTAPDCGPL